MATNVVKLVIINWMLLYLFVLGEYLVKRFQKIYIIIQSK